jgi:hypothetical protein
MRTLMSERFAPITTRIGFLRLPLDRVAAEAAHWMAGFEPNVRTRELRGPLEELLPHLEPLVGAIRPRMLFVAASGGAWTAYFDCLADGTDPVSPVNGLVGRLGCDGVRITTKPDEYGPDASGRYGRQGAVAFAFLRPGGPGDIVGTSVRSISVIREGSHFRFDTYGEVQSFERPERYASRRIRERFTSGMLEAYCRALGLDPFEASAYGPRAVLLECDARYVPKGSPAMFSLAAAQARLGIVPGTADRAPG